MLFDYKAIIKSSAEGENQLPGIFISKYINVHFQKVESLEDDLMRLPTDNEFFFLQTATAFNAFTFVLIISKIFSINNLHVSTSSLNIEIIDALLELHDKGRINIITLLISGNFINKQKKVYDYLISKSKERANLILEYASVNAKICLIETPHSYYVIEGSGNWNENAQIEQYVFYQSKALYEFRLGLFTNVKLKK